MSAVLDPLDPETLNGPEARVGFGAADELGPWLDERRYERIFLVAQEPGFTLSGAKDRLAAALAGRSLRSFTEFAPNPQWNDAVCGSAALRGFGADAIVAVGGGSVLDMAKLINALASANGPKPDLLSAPSWDFSHRIPWVAVPTTSGTGAEATGFAVVYWEGRKYSLAHPELRPDQALVDPGLTESLPRALTVATGLDALCQGIESWWSKRATPESRRFARAATQWAWRSLESAAHRPDPTHRLWMARAAHASGRAIHVSQTTAPHALSYRISSRYGAPHGIAVALTMAPLLAYNTQTVEEDALGEEGVRAILAALEFRDPDEAETGFRDFLRRLEAPDRLRQVGVEGAAALDDLVASVNAQRLANNPRELDESTLRRLLWRVA